VRRRVPLLALAAALAAVVLGSGAAAATPPSAASLESEIVCPVCGTTLDQSDAPVAQRMKAFIRARIAAGDSGQQIKDELVAQFGQEVLARPPKGGFGLLAWLLPLAAVVVGGVTVALLVRSWSARRGPPSDGAPLDPELERLVDDELARFDA
jgi:cytochrome c-type biogenesis protein CcmH